MKRHDRLLVAAAVTFALLFVAAALFSWQSGWLPLNGLSLEEATPVEIAVGGEAAASDNVMDLEFEWNYDRHPWQLSLSLPEDLYLYYRQVERAATPDYSIYVTHPTDDAYVRSIADKLDDEAQRARFDSEETVNFVASFVQSLDYLDELNGEYPKYPVETLVESGGDCEDTSILTAALLQAMGYDVVLLNFPPVTADEAGHMAVGVALPLTSAGSYYEYQGEKYYYLETTNSSKLGDIPHEYRTWEATILELVPKPVLKLSEVKWTMSPEWFGFGEDKLAVEVEVTNWGTADAEEVYVRAYFDEYETRTATSDPFDLDFGYKISPITVGEIVVPSGGGTLCVDLIDDGTRVDSWSKVI
jgi:hypothetical protein